MAKKERTTLRLSGGQSLIPRDISESLGKVPPQSLENEESVLAAILLEKNAINLVVPFLKSAHFYSEIHVQIYTAILSLHVANDPIDMRTVVNTLRKSGHLELVGGHYAIAELTNKASSSANIESHARVIVEMSIKRELINLASRIHHNAYEDTEDALELLQKTVEDINYLNKNSVPENSEAKIQSLWEKTLITVDPPEEPPLITINDTVIATQGNYSLIVGKKKTRKTLFIVLLVAEYLKKNPDNASKILLFDTEQGKKHVFRFREKIHQMTGLYLPVFYLRGQSPAERMTFIAQTVAHWKVKPLWIVIDGIRDLMININDPEESTSLIVWLEKITLDYNVHISNILHLNKSDNNARGHIGSELLNKAEVTIEMELDDKNNCTIVKCESSREKSFDSFAFTHDKDGLPVVVGLQIGFSIISSDEKKKRLEAIFDEQALSFKELTEEIRSHFSVGINKAASLLAEFQRQGWILKNGKSRHPDTKYKLLVSTNGHHTDETAQISLDLKVDTSQKEVNTDDLPF